MASLMKEHYTTGKFVEYRLPNDIAAFKYILVRTKDDSEVPKLLKCTQDYGYSKITSCIELD